MLRKLIGGLLGKVIKNRDVVDIASDAIADEAEKAIERRQRRKRERRQKQQDRR